MNGVVVVDALAVNRITRLVTADTITRPLRARLIALSYGTDEWSRSGMIPVGGYKALTESEWDLRPHDDDDAPKLAAFIICPWCVGLWISIGVVVARRYAPRVWQPLAKVLALSSAAALISGHEAAR